MACMFPEADDLRRYWENVLNGVDATRDVPPEPWQADQFYSSDRMAADKVYSRRGAFLGKTAFDPLKWRIPPAETREQIVAALDRKLPEWTQDSFAGFLSNIVASRIAGRLDLGGSAYTVDAACVSSLAAVQAAMDQLRSRTADPMIVGGIDGANHPFSYMSFSKTQALSPRERSTPLDDAADGIVLGEGVAAVLLKRPACARGARE